MSHGADPASPGLRAHSRIAPRPSGARAAETSAPAWCGPELAHDYRTRELANGPYRYHAIYMRPSDAPSDGFQAFAAQIQADAFGASGLLERLYGRAIRFDMGTRCGEGYLDITSLRAPLTDADFEDAASHSSGTLDAVTAVLGAAGFPVLRSGDDRSRAARLDTNYVVWLDAPAPAYTCGDAQVIDDATRRQTNWNNYGGKVAVVFRAGDGFCGTAAVRHEIGHTLGALQPGAAHAFDGTHCDDAYEDTMCYPSAPQVGGGRFEDEYFDYGNDDYWDPPGGQPLGWWTVDLSRFICPTTACNVAPARSARTRARRPRSSRATYRRASARRAG